MQNFMELDNWDVKGKTSSQIFPVMKTLDEQKIIYDSRFKTRCIQQIVLVCETEWRKALFQLFREKPHKFTCISIGVNFTFTVLLTYNAFEPHPINSSISFTWKQTYLSFFANEIAREKYDENYFNENFYTFFSDKEICDYVQWNWHELQEIEGRYKCRIVKELTKCYFITLKQQHIDYKIKNLLISSMHDFYKTMSGVEMQQIKRWNTLDRILMDEYVLSFLAKY